MTPPNSAPKQVVFHIGHMKTATTLLQEDVFPRIENTAFYCYPSGFPQRCSELRLHPDGTALTRLASEMRSWIVQSPAPLQLFSWEGLLGDYLHNYRGRSTMMDVIRAVSADATILIVTRRQADLVNSLYKQALHRGHSPSIANFTNWDGTALKEFRPGAPANIEVDALNFDRTARTFEDEFGPENVHIIAYEWLRQDPERFYTTLEECFGQNVPRARVGRSSNVGYKSRAARIARILNPLFRSPGTEAGILPYRPFDSAIARTKRGTMSRRLLSAINSLLDPRFYLQNRLVETVGGSSDLLTPAIREAIGEKCAASNQALDTRRGLGLRDLGYW
ncbi:MAG: hypothetical protein AAGK02_08745 [Pseudomonadota bacterium]